MSEGFIVFILSFSFLAYVVICFIRGLTGQQDFSPVSDNFKIGYIEREKPVVVEKPVVIYKDRQVKVKDKNQERKIKNLERKVEILTTKLKSNHVATEQQKEHPLYRDCVDAAVALGCKKREAAIGVKEFLKTNNVDSIEEFIVKYFKKG
jgi:hypothetical protein